MKMQSIVPVEGGVAALTRRIAVPVTALLLIGLVVILFVMWSAARDRDDVAATASLRTARSALNVLQEHLGRTISDYAIWDESMQHLHVTFDPAWASQNVGRYVAEDYQINTVLVISPSNQVVFAFEGNAPAENPPMFRDTDPTLQRLVAAARSANADEPQVTGFIRQNGRVHVAAASVINWYEDARKIPPHTATVLVMARDFEPPLISEITDNYELPGLRIAGEDDYRHGELVESLNAFGTSEPLGFVLWRPDLPGSALLRQLAAPVGSAIAVMVVLLAIIMLKHAERVTHWTRWQRNCALRVSIWNPRWLIGQQPCRRRCRNGGRSKPLSGPPRSAIAASSRMPSKGSFRWRGMAGTSVLIRRLRPCSALPRRKSCWRPRKIPCSPRRRGAVCSLPRWIVRVSSVTSSARHVAAMAPPYGCRSTREQLETATGGSFITRGWSSILAPARAPRSVLSIRHFMIRLLAYLTAPSSCAGSRMS